MATISDLQEQIRKVDDSITATINTGAQYAVAGSHSATNHSLEKLRKHRASLVARLRQAQGIPRRTNARFG